MDPSHRGDVPLPESRSPRRFRWPIPAVLRFEAPKERVWEVISTPGSLEAFHPFCRENPVEQWPGASARDAIVYYTGRMLERRFTRWIEGVGFDLEIWGDQVQYATVSWRLEALDADSCRLAVTVWPDLTPRLPALLKSLLHRTRVRPMLEKYLNQVLQGLDRYVTTGQPVRRNQFGSHRWFSRRE